MPDLIHHTAGTADTPSRKQLSRGGPARPRPRRAVTGLAVAVVSAVAVASAGCASSSTSSPAQLSASSPAAQGASSSGGAIHFPATLFGLGHNTSADAQQLARGIIHGLAVLSIITHPQVAVYGTGVDSQLIIVIISDLSAAAKKYGGKPSAAGMRRAALITGATGVQTFPTGKGAALGCGHVKRSGLTATVCMRQSKKTFSMATYFGTTASSLSDAAAKTNQAISASGG